MYSVGIEIEKKGQTQALLKQTHSAIVRDYDEVKNSSLEGDAVITHLPQTRVFVFTADCLPVLLYCPSKVAAIHAGWRGAMLGIVKKTLERFPKNTQAILGPCIKACCFEVKEDFVQSFLKHGRNVEPYLKKSKERMHFDLVSFVLKEELSKNIEVDLSKNVCTYCSKEELPSYRRNGNTLVQLKSWIELASTTS